MVIEIHQPTTPEHLSAGQDLFEEYVGTLTIDLAFQDYHRERDGFPDVYHLLLAASVDGDIAAAVAMKKIDDKICEMKRLYCRPAYRALGLGRKLAEALIIEGRNLGFTEMYLDTFDDMAAALALYRKLGFVEIPPYYNNPYPGAHFMSLALE